MMKVDQSLSGQTRPARARRTALPFALGLFALAVAVGSPARAEMSAEELAKLSQNPVANLISVPFQNNTNFNYGPLDGTQNILNIQPVIPVTLNKDWNLITRTIFPLLWQPGVVQGEGTTFGLGDMQFSAFLSPSHAKGWIWGVGAIAQLPTHTDSNLGNENWGLGPTAVVLRLEKDNPWVYGMLINNVWSLDTSSSAPSYNNFLFQPFVNYNLPGGTYINSVPIITANWDADSGNQWTVPLGAGIGHIFHLGKLPVNGQIGAYYNVVRPDNGPTWQLRVQVQFMFPK
jgi:hypothetical protein